MSHKLFRIGRLAGLTAAIAAVLATLWLVDASAATAKPDSCPTNKPLVVDVYFTAENTTDTGPDGHVWALDAGTRFIRIWRLGGDAYCVEIHDVGTFTTFAGLSPEGTGTVRAGVTGAFDGTIYYRFYGKFAPTVSTTGFLGNFDAQCQQDGSCAGDILHVGPSYFPTNLQHVDPGAFAVTYEGGACGTWSQTNSGDTGDIVC
jgi:hypothetical protein